LSYKYNNFMVASKWGIFLRSTKFDTVDRSVAEFIELFSLGEKISH